MHLPLPPSLLRSGSAPRRVDAATAGRPGLSFAASVVVHAAGLGGALWWSALPAEVDVGGPHGTLTFLPSTAIFAFAEPEPLEPLAFVELPDERSNEWVEPVLEPELIEPEDAAFEPLPDWSTVAVSSVPFGRRPGPEAGPEAGPGEAHNEPAAEPPIDAITEQPPALPDDPQPERTAGEPALEPTPEATGNSLAEPAHCPRPEYPVRSLRRGEEGTVRCALHVDAAGRVTRVDILSSSGHERLDRRAREVLATWTFAPATAAGLSVASVVEHDVEFRLR